MKILLTIHHELDPNLGAPGVTWRLGQEYLKLGHEVTYFSFDDLPKLVKGIAKSVFFPEFTAAKINSLIKNKRVDAIDASTGDAWFWAKFYKGRDKNRRNRNSGQPILATRSHGLEQVVHQQLLEEAKLGNTKLSWKYPIYHGGFRLWEVAQSLALADLALLLNNYDLEYAVQNLGLSPERAFVVKNGILDLLLGLPQPTVSNTSTVRIAHIGSYIARKGIHYSVPALNAILQRFPEVEVSFLGSIATKDVIMQDFDPSLANRIQVIPRYSNADLPSLLSGHEIHLFPSLSEGFGLAVVEAMACGLAPIVTAIPGPTAIVTDDFDAVLIPPRDQLAIEEAIAELITNQDKRDRLRNNAYHTAQQYSWEAIAKYNLSLYEKFMD